MDKSRATVRLMQIQIKSRNQTKRNVMKKADVLGDAVPITPRGNLKPISQLLFDYYTTTMKN